MEYICELKNVSKRFHTINNETKAIDDISFKVRKGEIVSIVGPSGSGKSTVLSLIAGLEKPSEGEVIVNTKSIGFMFQKDQLYEWRNVYKNCLLGLEVKNMDNEENKIKVKKMLEKYGLTNFKRHYPSQLSGGMRQRAALVRTLAIEPDLLLLDELLNMLGGGKILVQRYGDILDGKRTWQHELSRSNVKPTLPDAVAGDLTAAMPYRTMTNILNFIEALNVVVPGFAGTETLLYGPEVKFYSNKVEISTEFETNIKNLYCLGDASGWTRGLMMSSLMGVRMGQILGEKP